MSEEWDGTDRRAPPAWRLKREISIGDVMAFCSAALAVVYAYTTLDKRMTVLEIAAVAQKDIDRRQDDESIRYQARIGEELRSINNKLDRVLAK